MASQKLVFNILDYVTSYYEYSLAKHPFSRVFLFFSFELFIIHIRRRNVNKTLRLTHFVLFGEIDVWVNNYETGYSLNKE